MALELKCSICNKMKPTSEFSKGKNKSGYRSQCKECIHQAYLKNKEKILQKHKEYYESNKESYLHTCRVYKNSNKDSIKSKMHDYYLSHSETIKERSKRQFQNFTPEQMQKRKKYLSDKFSTEEGRSYKRMKFHFRNAQIKKLPNTLTESEWEENKNLFDNRCAYCGKESKLTQDHIIPVSRLGGYTKNNIVPCCPSCNSSKQDKDFVMWYKTMPFFNENRLNKIFCLMES